MDFRLKNISDQLMSVTPFGKEEALEIDTHNSKAFVASICNKILNKNKHVFLDMTHVTYVDSSGLWALNSVNKQMKVAGYTLFFSNIDEDIHRVIQSIKFDERFNIVDSLADALKVVS